MFVSDAIKEKASHIILGAKKCVVARLSQKKLRKNQEKLDMVNKSLIECNFDSSNSDCDFMPSQSLRTFCSSFFSNGTESREKLQLWKKCFDEQHCNMQFAECNYQ